MTATELAGRIAARQVSATEAVTAYLDRLNDVDKKLNAVTVLMLMPVSASRVWSVAPIIA